MINEYLIKGLKAHKNLGGGDASPSYFVVIKDVSQKNECNKDSLEFSLMEVHEDIDSFFENSSVTNKSFTITTNMVLDENDLYSSKLIGFEGRESASNTNTNPINTSHRIEVIETTLEKTIDIEFSKPYKSKKIETRQIENEGNITEENIEISLLPSIIVNIEKEYESLYRKYSTEYKQNEEGDYIGVKITFQNLKTKMKYPTIKITIIGEDNPSYQPNT